MKIRQQRTIEKNICKKMILLSFCMILMVSMAGCGNKRKENLTITNVSYDPTREFYEKYNKDFIKYIEMDSVESCVMRSAFEMMDNTFNLESPIATITDSGIKVFPNSDDIEKIIENPANWVVVPLLFKECDD